VAPSTSAGGSSPAASVSTGTSDSVSSSADANSSSIAASSSVGYDATTSEASGETTGTTNAYNPDFVEFYGADCDVPEPSDVNNSKLPDPFLGPDGMRIANKADWKCQRAYLKAAVEKYIHGTKPGTPEKVTGSVTASGVTVQVEHGGVMVMFTAAISGIPAGADGPVPLMISLGPIGGVGSEGDTDFGKTIRDEGVAVMNYGHNAISSESDRSGIFHTVYGNTNASAQVGWAWGVSRIIDVLVAEKEAGRNDIIDPTAVGVTGCSRNGKGAFTIGAFDERIALGLPQESGTAGVSALRIVATGQPVGPNGKAPESISAAKSAGSGWLGPDFDQTYSRALDTMPVDMNSLVAMYVPRGLLVLDNSRIGELGSVAQHAATYAGRQVAEAMGVGGNIAYHGGNPSDPHGHCSFYQTQVPAVQAAIRAHLTRTAEPDGKIEPQPVGTADLDEWIDWETPTF
jgi:hypothetical protein